SRALGLAVLTCLLSAPAGAQPAVGGEFRVNSFTAGDQIAPDVSMNARTGEFFVMWNNQPNCFGQRFDAAGKPLGDTFLGSGGCNGGGAVTAFRPGGFVTMGI